MKRLFFLLFFAFALIGLYIFIPFENIIKFSGLISFDGKIDPTNIVLLRLFYNTFIFTLFVFLITICFGLEFITNFLRIVFSKIEKVQSGKWLVCILFIAVIIRIILLLMFDNLQVSDFSEYHDYAKNISEGKGYIRDGQPTAWFPIGYPFVLSLIYSLFSINELYGKIFNIILSVILIIMVYKLSEKIFNETTAKLASMFIALWPNLCGYTLLLNSDLPFTVLLTILLLLLVSLKNNRYEKIIIFCSGIFFACATLTRSLLGGFVVVILVHIALFTKKTLSLRFLKLSAIFVLGAIIVFSPWWIRNYHTFGKFIPLSTNGGFNFWLSNVQLAKGNDPTINPSIWPKNECDINSFGYKSGLKQIRQNPSGFIKQIPIKIINLFIKDVSGFQWISQGINDKLNNTVLKLLMIISQIYYTIMIILAMTGLYFYFRNRKINRINFSIPFIAIYWIIIHSIYFGKDRFHLPLIPIIAIFASYGVYYLFYNDKISKENC